MATEDTTTTSLEIPKGGYVAFDATSLRQLIVNRLNEQEVFTDQNFIGSNLASVIDIIAYSYHTLIYYLNKTSTESMFSQSQLYENMNQIVKLIDYSPIGFQTSTLSFECSASTFNTGLYTIPRYSYVSINNIPYSFNEDITFVKQSNLTTEYLQELSQQKLLYQGQYQEYPLYTAAGDDNETVILDTANEFVDHFNINVYIKPFKTGIWEQFSSTTSLYLEDSISKKYEIRINGNYRYEIKFGNGINGQKLQPGDVVAIYYLKSLGAAGEVGPGALSQGTPSLITYSTLQFNNILNNVLESQRFVTSNEGSNFSFNNTSNSTASKTAETAEEIRRAAPSNYQSQYRLVTSKDYESFIRTNFANFITDVKVFNNWEYVSKYLNYFYSIGIQDPQKTDRALLNQVLYADACNFNNVYIIVVPRSNNQSLNFLMPAQKEAINTSILDNKMTTTETVFIDPVYKVLSLGVSDTGDFEPELNTNNFQLEIIKNVSSRRSDLSIINDIVNIFTTYFSRATLKLGQTVDVRSLNQQILGVNGVNSYYTVNTENNIKAEGLSLFVWNPLYPENDRSVVTNNIPLETFEYPYFDNLDTLSQLIKVTSTSTVFEVNEY